MQLLLAVLRHRMRHTCNTGATVAQESGEGLRFKSCSVVSSGTKTLTIPIGTTFVMYVQYIIVTAGPAGFQKSPHEIL